MIDGGSRVQNCTLGGVVFSFGYWKAWRGKHSYLHAIQGELANWIQNGLGNRKQVVIEGLEIGDL